MDPHKNVLGRVQKLKENVSVRLQTRSRLEVKSPKCSLPLQERHRSMVESECGLLYFKSSASKRFGGQEGKELIGRC